MFSGVGRGGNVFEIALEQFEDTKGVTRSRKSKKDNKWND